MHWYEASLPQRERKARGHFSTPPRLVEQILDACGYTPDKDLSQLRVLDPACGSGNFLAGATRRLLTYGQRANRSALQSARSIKKNIWGFDPDPIACTLAELQLHATFTDSYPDSQALRHTHIHQADGLAFPWQHHSNIDLFLANPPYLAAKNIDLSGYRSTHQRGQADSYLLFLRLALQVVKPAGWIGLVLPDPVLARANAARERELLLSETTIHHIWHLADVFAAYVGAVVIIAQKTPPNHLHHISWQRSRWSDTASPPPTINSNELALEVAATVSQSLLSQQPGAELRYLLSSITGTLVERLQHQIHQPVKNGEVRRLGCMGEYVMIRRGEELGKDNPLLTANPPTTQQSAWRPVLRGGIDVHPYEIPRARYWIASEQIAKPLDRYLAPKLLLVKSSGRLQATLDLHGHIVLQTLYILQLAETWSDTQANEPGRPAFSTEEELYFLLALLNSRILQEYMYTLHTAYKLVQPQIEQHVLAQLPIPINTAYTEKVQIIDRAKLLMHACDKASSVVELKIQNLELYEEQERAICVLYETALEKMQALDLPRSGIDEGVSLYG
ncbi:N-6 DNA methylase [Dictyobacter vulcani]|uniref:N-6 DNA methylase n=1 Tax=Dictyobacter vulcani TaxID=2607529 RepID=UPI001387296E|nr:N-6 DNA methylase [Dictyobacter vulcani]